MGLFEILEVWFLIAGALYFTLSVYDRLKSPL